MLSNNEVTEGLLIVVLGVNFVLLFFIAWHVATARLYFRQVHRLAIAVTETVRKIDCDELIDEMPSCSGETTEKQHYEGTAGDSLAPPDACSGGTAGHEVTGQKAPERVQNYRERLASVAEGGGGSSRAVWVTCSRKSINRQPYRGA